MKVIGNFPYNISSQIFFKILENRDLVPECVGMIQREVAVRLAEPPGSKEYGILSVLLQAWYDIEYLFTVNETVFNPPPKVKSAVIRLRRNGVERLDCDERLFVRVVKASFGQRRKMLRNSLRAVFGNFGGEEHPFFSRRAETLSVAEFVELTRWVAAHIGAASADGAGADAPAERNQGRPVRPEPDVRRTLRRAGAVWKPRRNLYSWVPPGFAFSAGRSLSAGVGGFRLRARRGAPPHLCNPVALRPADSVRTTRAACRVRGRRRRPSPNPRGPDTVAPGAAPRRG